MPSLFEFVLGKAGKWFSVAANLLILYGLLTAYLAGVSTAAVESFHLPLPGWVVMLISFCIITLLTSLGDAVLRQGNAILMVPMWALFALLLVLVVPHFEGVDPGAMDMSFFTSGLPATVPLNRLIHSKVFVNVSIAFSVVAMSTSYMGTGAGLMRFIRDVAGERLRSRCVVWLLSFVPPLLMGVLYPNGFLGALNVVGGQELGMLKISPDVEYWSQHSFNFTE